MRAPPGPVTGLFAGRYTIERVIGVGATATVHLARDTKRGTAVAIKLLRPELLDSRATERFLKEIARTATLSHPHILPVLDSGEQNGHPYFVLPYMEGGTLRQVIEKERAMELDRVIQIARTIAGALDYAHSQGLIHRDVKPENILFTEGQAVLGDFGIARAIDLSGSSEITTSTSRNTVRGTAAYMSPEQAAGSRELDGRSDIYSLACVLYEMLTGMQAFIGPTAESVISQRFAFQPRDVRVYRPSLPRAVDVALGKAFSMTPGDRYRTAGAFVGALEAALAAGSTEQTGNGTGTVRRYLGSRRTMIAGATGATILSLALGGWLMFGGRAMDPELYAVAPFNVANGASGLAFDGGATATLVYDALRRWPDLKRVDPLRVNDLISRTGKAPTSLAEAMSIARAMRAGKLLWGELHEQGGRTVIRGVLYDLTATSSQTNEASIALTARGDDSLSIRFAALVDSLVAGAQPRPAAGSSHAFAAVRAYAAGISAMNSWDLRKARNDFATALESEPQYAAANLRLAQVSQWLRTPAAGWKPAISSAVSGESELSMRDRVHARALLAMADADYPNACKHFARLIQRDSFDFAGWFGLGDCTRDDRLVQRDSTSPSRWRFRSSRQTAMTAYSRAFEIVPTSYRAYREMLGVRLETTFITRDGDFRDGYSTDSSGGVFAAFPELSGDTIAFIPFRVRDFTEKSRLTRHQSVGAALERSRRQLEQLSLRWVNSNPQSADAWEIRATALERGGMITGHRDRSAIGALVRARQLASEPNAKLRLAKDEVRLRIKSAELAVAGRLTDSILTSTKDATPEMAVTLSSLAGLAGDLELMEQLVDRAAPIESFVSMTGTAVQTPPSITATALRLMVNAALRGPRDTLDALERKIESYLATIPNQSQRAETREAVLRTASMFAYPWAGARPLHAVSARAPYLLGMQARLSLGDSAGVRRDLLALGEQRKARGLGPGRLAIDATFLEASLFSELGDVSNAVARLDDALDNLTFQRDWFRDIHAPAALVSAIKLRSRLAEQMGDSAKARAWRSAAAALRSRAK
jgi:eukaryotic-like serine/threonine-protein kinase